MRFKRFCSVKLYFSVSWPKRESPGLRRLKTGSPLTLRKQTETSLQHPRGRVSFWSTSLKIHTGSAAKFIWTSTSVDPAVSCKHLFVHMQNLSYRYHPAVIKEEKNILPPGSDISLPSVESVAGSVWIYLDPGLVLFGGEVSCLTWALLT